MSQIAFSNGAVIVNNVSIAVLPNSIKITKGKGDRKVRAMQIGGGAVETVHTEDISTKIGKVSFELAVTDSNISLIESWQNIIGGNMVMIVQEGVNPIVLQNASVTNDPELDASADGKATVEFQGDPISST